MEIASNLVKVKKCFLFILILILFSCKSKDWFSVLIISNEWQCFNQYSIESENIVNNTYTIFKENHDIETYLINSEDYPLITGNKWHFNKTDSVFYYGDIRFKIQKYQNDTIYMLNDKKEKSYLIKR